MGLAADKDRHIVVLAFKDTARPVMVWDATKKEIIGEYMYSPEPNDGAISMLEPPRMDGPLATSKQPLGTPSADLETGGHSPCRLDKVRAWISPTLASPVLALLWTGEPGGELDPNLQVINYISKVVLYESHRAEIHGELDDVCATFSGDGNTLVLQTSYMLYVLTLSTKGDGNIGVACRYSRTADVYGSLFTLINFYSCQLQSSFDGSRLMVVAGYVLCALLPPRPEEASQDTRTRSYDPGMVKDRAPSPVSCALPTGASRGSCYLVISDRKIFLLSTRFSTTVLFWPPKSTTSSSLHQQDSQKGHVIFFFDLVMNDEGSRAVWECFWGGSRSSNTGCSISLVVADITPSLTQCNEAMIMDTQRHPVSNVVLNRPLDFTYSRPCLLLNKSADRLLRRQFNLCELRDIPSGTLLATQDLMECWTTREPDTSKRDELPLLQHPTELEWLVCVDVNMQEPVMMISWRDLAVGTCRDVGIPGQVPREESDLSSPVHQPAPCDPFTALLSGLETLMPKIAQHRSTNYIYWRSCFDQYLSMCKDIDPCVCEVASRLDISDSHPIAFFAPSRTLVFMSNESWVYSIQVAPHIVVADNGDLHVSPSYSPTSNPSWRSGEGVFSPACEACGLSHPIRARRHFHTWGYDHDWNCFWADGGTAPDDRRKLDFTFWGDDLEDRIIVRDGLRYADEVEWVEYRNEEGNVWKSEWMLVEREPSDGDPGTGRYA